MSLEMSVLMLTSLCVHEQSQRSPGEYKKRHVMARKMLSPLGENIQNPKLSQGLQPWNFQKTEGRENFLRRQRK